MTKTLLKEKLNEAVTSVMPITLIVLALCLSITPIPNSLLVSFAFGAVLLVIGMAFFYIGSRCRYDAHRKEGWSMYNKI